MVLFRIRKGWSSLVASGTGLNVGERLDAVQSVQLCLLHSRSRSNGDAPERPARRCLLNIPTLPHYGVHPRLLTYLHTICILVLMKTRTFDCRHSTGDTSDQECSWSWVLPGPTLMCTCGPNINLKMMVDS